VTDAEAPDVVEVVVGPVVTGASVVIVDVVLGPLGAAVTVTVLDPETTVVVVILVVTVPFGLVTDEVETVVVGVLVIVVVVVTPPDVDCVVVSIGVPIVEVAGGVLASIVGLLDELELETAGWLHFAIEEAANAPDSRAASAIVTRKRE
jgi:hypothetical protein